MEHKWPGCWLAPLEDQSLTNSMSRAQHVSVCLKSLPAFSNLGGSFETWLPREGFFDMWSSPMARGLARRPACWGVARPTPSTTRPQEPRPTAAGFPVGGVLGVRRALVLGGQGKWFGVVLEFRGFRLFFRSALEFDFQRFGVWSVSQLFGKGCFLLAGSGLEVNWFGVAWHGLERWNCFPVGRRASPGCWAGRLVSGTPGPAPDA